MELLWLIVLCFISSVSNALDCSLPTDSVVNQLLKDEVTSGGGEGSTTTIRGGPYYVCQVQGTTNGTYQELSVIMEYTSNTIDRVGQFEMICQISPDGWSSRLDSLTVLSVGSGVTYDGSIGLWTNCSSCINTAGNDNHCVACNSSCNFGLMRCTGSGSDDCCVAFNNISVCQPDYTFQCVGNPCNNGGTCTGLQDGYTCTCAEGYTGTNCDIDINECEDSPCLNSGTCNDEIADYTCTCVDGFTDKNCSTNIDDCASDPCINNGTCMDGISDYSCMCVDGFTGDHCETDINECESKPCLNGATCIDQVNNYTCVCAPGFTGNDCSTEINYCSNTSCMNGGTCISLADGFICICPYEYTGDNCDTYIDACDSSPCMNGSTCTSSGGPDEYTCICVDGFTGTNCDTDINECEDSPCQNGTCINEEGGYSCACIEGFTGTNCDININECMDSNPCQNNGTCTDTVPGYICTCTEGFTGTNCDTDINECLNNPCQNGTCINEEGGYSCACIDGFTGTNCDSEINECEDSPCSNGGTCVEELPGYSCICSFPYTGIDCESSLSVFEICQASCSEEQFEFERNLCIYNCQMEEWKKAMTEQGVTLPYTEEPDDNALAFDRWKKVIENYHIYYDAWDAHIQERRLEVYLIQDDQQEIDIDNSSSTWKVLIETTQSFGFTTWREYFIQLYPSANFQELPQYYKVSTDEEFSEVFYGLSEWWSNNWKTYKTAITPDEQ